eukprot:1159726-Pelagomonas_calceolata.AAC.1
MTAAGCACLAEQTNGVPEALLQHLVCGVELQPFLKSMSLHTRRASKKAHEQQKNEQEYYLWAKALPTSVMEQPSPEGKAPQLYISMPIPSQSVALEAANWWLNTMTSLLLISTR